MRFYDRESEISYLRKESQRRSCVLQESSLDGALNTGHYLLATCEEQSWQPCLLPALAIWYNAKSLNGICRRIR